mmetsp:Transcript_30885/g.65441  ORF Transcript_30885/g.65441 Transcript_30885/m.65441 type:complete len:264 (+) Transcript_30885:1677-2468(+)
MAKIWQRWKVGPWIYRSKVEPVQPKVNTSIKTSGICSWTTLCSDNDDTILDVHLRRRVSIPHLRYVRLQGEDTSLSVAKPDFWHRNLSFAQELGQHASLSQSLKMMDDAAACSNDRKVSGETFCIPHQGMIWASKGDVLKLLQRLVEHLLPRLDTHRDLGDKHVVLREVHRRLPHAEPLASGPSAQVLGLLPHFEAAEHTNCWLRLLPHGDSLQVAISLEENLTHLCACQPSRFEGLLESALIAVAIAGSSFAVVGCPGGSGE